MANYGSIFQTITGRGHREFNGDTKAIFECATTARANRVRSILRMTPSDKNHFSPNGGGWVEKLRVDNRSIDEIFQEALESL